MSTPPSQKYPPRPSPYSGQSPRQSVRPQLPPADPELQQRAWAAVMLALISLFGLIGAFAVVMGGNADRSGYVDGVALVIAALALWLSVTSMRRARRANSARPRAAVFATVLSSTGLALTALMLPSLVTYAPQLSQYVRCLSSATTSSAQQACQQQLENSTGTQISFFNP